MDYGIETIAQMCHEVNRSWCVVNGDGSQKPWHYLDAETQQSAMEGVMAVVKDADITPEQSHQNWMEFKKQHGWVYGEEKDVEKKTHPCLVPYDQLSKEHKIKDELFINTAKALYKHV